MRDLEEAGLVDYREQRRERIAPEYICARQQQLNAVPRVQPLFHRRQHMTLEAMNGKARPCHPLAIELHRMGPTIWRDSRWLNGPKKRWWLYS